MQPVSYTHLAADLPFCALREEGYGMAQGMNKLNEALASLPEVRELLLSLCLLYTSRCV